MGQRKRQNATSRAKYLLFALPFILAYVSWVWFPVLAEYVIRWGFGYVPMFQAAHWLWYLTVGFLYTWYTFLAIGIGGSFVVAAWLWKQRKVHVKVRDYPAVSFIVPAYNEEKVISRCITSLFRCAANCLGPSEIIVVDDGSTDHTYEVAWATIEVNRRLWPRISGKVVRHTTNLGKAEAVRTGVNKAMGEVLSTVDADSWWDPATLTELVNYMNAEDKTGVTGYIHPSNGNSERNLYVILQQLEYSQGLGIFRCAQALGNAVLVVPGPIGLYEANALRNILNEKILRSVTEDLEITLEMQKRGLSVGYVGQARSSTIAPASFGFLWDQRLRWFIGGLHNMLGIHRDMLFNRRWLSLLLWYCLIIGYGGAILELIAVFGAPLLFLFAPDRLFFLFNLALFLPYAFLIGIVCQAIALKFSYNQFNHRRLLFYTPLYTVLRFINVCARFVCLIKYSLGKRGTWHKS